jgi:hypothetical protein
MTDGPDINAITPYWSGSGVEIYCGDCVDVMSQLSEESVDLVFGSPSYCDARTYGIEAQRDCPGWVEWMLKVTRAAARVCRGPVVWVAAGVTRDRNYWPACEGLMWEWWKCGGQCQLYRPCAFYRVGIPGSGGSDWFRADWEYVMCFKRPGQLPWSDNTACGHPPKWAPGGALSHRLTDGTRRNQRQKKFRRADGEIEEQNYTPPTRANPGTLSQQVYTADEVAALLEAASDVSRHVVGGGAMGSQMAHNNEAPFPESLAERYVRSLCPEDGVVLEPFCGSGTTPAVCQRWGRRAIAIDCRESQCQTTQKRCQGRLF